MAVTSLLTLIEDMEGSPSLTSIGGGQGAGTNTDIFIEGSQSVARRSSGSDTHGFYVGTATVDLSGAGQHVRFWTFLTHYAVVTDLRYRIGNVTSAYRHFTFPLSTEYPSLGGWVPVWVDADGGNSVGFPNIAQAAQFGQTISIPSVGGNAPNNILDAISHGTSGLLWDGAGGELADFIAEDSANALGVLLLRNGVYFCLARLEIGSATATTFTDSAFVILFPDQSLVETTFMGLTIDLQNASTDIVLTDGVVSSGNPVNASRRPDILVSGTSGSLDLSRNRLAGMRVMNLNSAVTAEDSVFANCGPIDAAGAVLQGSSVADSIVDIDESSLIWDVATSPAGRLDGMSFSKGPAAHHAIEFGENSPTSIALSGVRFNGFNASNGENDSALHIKRTSGTVTINISEGGDVPSYKSDGATVDIQATVNVSLTGILADSEVTIVRTSDDEVLFHVEDSEGGTEIYSHDGSAVNVDVLVFHVDFEPVAINVNLGGSAASIPIQQVEDFVYLNP